MFHLLQLSVTLHFLLMFLMFLTAVTASLNSINQLIFGMVKCCVLFDVWTEILNIIQTNVASKSY
jgi:hypothetical protein